MNVAIRSIHLAILAILCICCSQSPAADSAPRPNVVFILADDMGFSDAGCYGGEIATPNLDALAARGLRFTQFYNTARCWPSRGVLLTGHYAQAIRRDGIPGTNFGSQGQRPAWAPLLPAMLRPLGYRSYHSGKWHVDGTPLAGGFDRAYTFDDHNRYFAPRQHTEDDKPLPAVAPGSGYYATTAIADHAIKCLREHADQHAGQPFFQYIAFTSPHFPLHAPQQDIDRYHQRYRVGWNAVQVERGRRLKELGIATNDPPAMERDVGPPYDFSKDLGPLGPGEVLRPLPWSELTDEQREFQATKMSIHAAMVDRMDREIGRVIDQLKTMGVFDNTLILFASDNGASAEIMIRGDGHDAQAALGSAATFLCLGPGWSNLANTPFRRHKTWVHEGGISTPLIAHWPKGIVPARRDELRHNPSHLIDIVPTVLELAGSRHPQTWNDQPVPPPPGKSLVPVFARDGTITHDDLWWFHDGHRAIRVGDWKLVSAGRDGPWELYDLSRDRGESNNLAAKHPDKVRDLESRWNQRFEEFRSLATRDTPPGTGASEKTKKSNSTSPRPENGPAAKTKPPNVVVLLADDQGWGDLSVTGNTQLKTPHIDSLARDGVTLDRFYVCSVCAPTRAEFLTGRYHSRGGVRGVSTGQERLNTDERTIAQAFKATGYATGAFGKWHNGSQWPYHPNARGFDEYYGFTSGHWGEYFDAPLEHNGQPVRGKGFVADDFTNHAIGFIEEHKDRPFFCYLPFNTPHSPFCVPDEFWQRFKDKPITQRGRDGDKETVDVTRAVLAMCENIDWNVSRVLAKLDELKLRDNTIVLYFSDNGPNSVRWNGGMKGIKGSTDEGGVRSPCFIRWPAKLKGGTTVREICGAIDLLPTLTSLAGVPRVGPGAPGLDGKDISPLLTGIPARQDWPDRMIFSRQNGKVSVRTQQYRLDDRSALFDMAADPGQTTNIAKQQPEVAARLTAAVADWRRDVLPAGKDDRPFPVGPGAPGFPRTWLPARDGVPHGNVRRSANAPNCSYFVNWTDVNDRITWDIETHTGGNYEVTLHYTCAEGDAGSTIELSFLDAKLSGQVAPAWDPPLITNQDVIPRPPAESIMKEFRPLKLGVVRLAPGRSDLSLRATKVAGEDVMHLRGVTLTLLP